MGRITNSSTRSRIHNLMHDMLHRYSRAFKDNEMQEALKELITDIDREMAAMIYWGHFSACDMMAITAAVDNRRLIRKLTKDICKIGKALNNKHKREMIPTHENEN